MEKTKSDLRKEFKIKRLNLSKSKADEKSGKIIENLVLTDAFKRARTVLIYKSINNEVSLDALPLLDKSKGKKFAYPVCVSRTEMKAYLPGSFKKGAFGITEPDPADSKIVPPEDIDLVICPGTAFDDKLHRLGMGGGYYDRFLKECKNARFFMVAFEIQHSDYIPTEESDVRMDMIITEEKIYE
ncbi:MAG: 5-formyltetrahydrofolate cyclo-ligase [Clostridia bacterium]|nr:5-formyltetrahydrofolate cyclo-ligase [Clostridia bacterium]